jgi:L-malate glycosyltransferase
MRNSINIKSQKSLRVVYANWPEGIINQRFINALVKKYLVMPFFFDETGTKIIRLHFPSIDIPPEAHAFMVRDPPLIDLPLNIRLEKRKGGIGWVLKYFMRALIFRLSLKRLCPDILIGNGVSGPNPYGLCCAFSGFHPFLVIVWGSDILVEARNSIVFRMITRFVLKKADGVIVDSDVKTKAVLAFGVPKNRIWKFLWGIDLTLFNAKADGSIVRSKRGWEENKVIISTRNHFPIYGIEYLIRSVPFVIKEIPSARFMILGEGSNTYFLKEMVKELGIQKYVNFIGRVPNEDLPSYIKAADLYVSTSLSDGASISLVEAMACGLPVVVSDISGNQEWVKNGRNGFLVPVKNSVALAEKIVFLLKNDDLRRLLGENNSELALSKADWKKNVQVLYHCIESFTVA